MSSHYTYSMFKTSWGIYVKITAELVSYTGFEGTVVEAVTDIHLSLAMKSFNVPEEEIAYLKLGTQLVEKQVREKLSDRLPIVIRILEIDINVVDYQPEGLTCALAGWLAQEIGINYSLPDPYYDKEAKRYIFNFPESLK